MGAREFDAPQVAEFDDAGVAEEDVGGLEVAVHDSLRVQVAHCDMRASCCLTR